MIAQPTFLAPFQVREVFTHAFSQNLPVKVEFVKRTTGERRKMRCSAVPATQLRAMARRDLDAAEAGTLFVWDLDKHKPASVPVEAVLSVVAEGVT